MMNHNKKFVALLVLTLTTIAVGTSQAECFISTHIEAELNTDDPGLGTWKYTVILSWDTGTQYGLSHFNIWLDEEGFNCGCAEIASSLNLVNPAGLATGEGGACSVPFDSYLECGGDPSLGINGILIKFEPDEDTCEAGASGEGSFVFYSNYSPAPVALPNSFVVDKHGQLSCYGSVTGVFPGLACNPVGTLVGSWGSIKSIYR